MTEHTSQTNKLAALWKECIASLRDLILGYGRPIDLMRWGRMRALEHRGLGHWLRDLEALVRRAITSDALTRTVPAPNLHRRQRTGKRCAYPASPGDMPRLRASDPTDPTTWRVSFRMSTREYDPTRKRSPGRNPPNLDPEARRPCRGYAFRIEALRRAILGREAYIMRYAGRLARRAEAARVNDPIFLPLPHADDPPERQPIIIGAETAWAPPAYIASARDTAPRNAKHIEPG